MTDGIPETPAAGTVQPEQRAPVIVESTITCPACGHAEAETMPTDACQWFYDCRHCGTVLKPKSGDCCVYCSYATVPCPPVQMGYCGI